MRKSIKYVGAALFVGACAAGGFVQATKASLGPREFALSTAELYAAGSFNQALRQLSGEVARIASGDERRAREIIEIASGAQAVERGERELADAASRRLGVAVVRSGTVWAERR